MHVLRVATALVALDLRVLTDEEHLAAQTGQTGSEGRQQSPGIHVALQMLSVSMTTDVAFDKFVGYRLLTEGETERNIVSPTSAVNIRFKSFLHPLISTFAMLERSFSIRPRPTGSFRRFAANSEEGKFWLRVTTWILARCEASAILFREKPPENLLDAQELLREVGSQSELAALGTLHPFHGIQIESTKWTTFTKSWAGCRRASCPNSRKLQHDATRCDFHLDVRTFSDQSMQLRSWVAILSCGPFHTCFIQVWMHLVFIIFLHLGFDRSMGNQPSAVPW